MALSSPPRGPFVPPVYFLASVGAMAVLHRYWPLFQVLETPYRYSGIVVIVLSIAPVLWAGLLFKRADTGIVPFTPATSLVVAGPYRFTRNPMYVGMAGALLGVALLFGTLAPLVGVPIFVALIQWRFILAEEAMLTENFGQPYRDYRTRVRRWL